MRQAGASIMRETHVAGGATRIHYLDEDAAWREKEERARERVREEEARP